LAACRALGRRADYLVGVAGCHPGRLRAGPAASSRYVKRYHVLPDPGGSAAAFEEALSGLVLRRKYDVILATDDSTLTRLSTIRPPVPTFPHVGAPFLSLTDKLALAATCASIDVPYPATRAADDDDQTRQAIEELTLPVVVKSSRTAVATPNRVRMAKGAHACWDVASALAAAREMRAAGLPAIVQSRVASSEKLNAVVIRNDGTSEYRYAHSVLREHPLTGGTGVALQTVPADAGPGLEAVELLGRLCDAVGYEGMAQAEFCRSADDGRLYVVDVNPRLWGSTWFAERLGQRVTERGVRFALDDPPIAPSSYAIGRRFHALGELRWLRDQKNRSAGLAQLARTTRPWDTFDYVDASDPLPLAIMVLASMRGHRPA
jgi:predicted ATP-grasp superfamily ATP-dependent carboligase